MISIGKSHKINFLIIVLFYVAVSAAQSMTWKNGSFSENTLRVFFSYSPGSLIDSTCILSISSYPSATIISNIHMQGTTSISSSIHTNQMMDILAVITCIILKCT
jgi:hypothetical protein